MAKNGKQAKAKAKSKAAAKSTAMKKAAAMKTAPANAMKAAKKEELSEGELQSNAEGESNGSVESNEEGDINLDSSIEGALNEQEGDVDFDAEGEPRGPKVDLNGNVINKPKKQKLRLKKKKAKAAVVESDPELSTSSVKRGRPFGSKNKPKEMTKKEIERLKKEAHLRGDGFSSEEEVEPELKRTKKGSKAQGVKEGEVFGGSGMSSTGRRLISEKDILNGKRIKASLKRGNLPPDDTDYDSDGWNEAKAKNALKKMNRDRFRHPSNRSSNEDDSGSDGYESELNEKEKKVRRILDERNRARSSGDLNRRANESRGMSSSMNSNRATSSHRNPKLKAPVYGQSTEDEENEFLRAMEKAKAESVRSAAAFLRSNRKFSRDKNEDPFDDDGDDEQGMGRVGRERGRDREPVRGRNYRQFGSSSNRRAGSMDSFGQEPESEADDEDESEEESERQAFEDEVDDDAREMHERRRNAREQRVRFARNATAGLNRRRSVSNDSRERRSPRRDNENQVSKPTRNEILSGDKAALSWFLTSAGGINLQRLRNSEHVLAEAFDLLRMNWEVQWHGGLSSHEKATWLIARLDEYLTKPLVKGTPNDIKTLLEDNIEGRRHDFNKHCIKPCFSCLRSSNDIQRILDQINWENVAKVQKSVQPAHEAPEHDADDKESMFKRKMKGIEQILTECSKVKWEDLGNLVAAVLMSAAVGSLVDMSSADSNVVRAQIKANCVVRNEEVFLSLPKIVNRKVAAKGWHDRNCYKFQECLLKGFLMRKGITNVELDAVVGELVSEAHEFSLDDEKAKAQKKKEKAELKKEIMEELKSEKKDKDSSPVKIKGDKDKKTLPANTASLVERVNDRVQFGEFKSLVPRNFRQHVICDYHQRQGCSFNKDGRCSFDHSDKAGESDSFWFDDAKSLRENLLGLLEALPAKGKGFVEEFLEACDK